MKTTIAKISIVLSLVIFSFCCSSCKKDNILESVYYKYSGVEELTYILSEESTVVEFINELSGIMEKYDGNVIINESNLRKDIGNVVKKYDNGAIAGTFHLMKASKEDGPWSVLESWTMNFNSKYNVRSGIVSVKTIANK